MVSYDTSTFTGIGGTPVPPHQRPQTDDTHASTSAGTGTSSGNAASNRNGVSANSSETFTRRDEGTRAGNALPMELNDEMAPRLYVEEDSELASKPFNHDKRQINCCEETSEPPLGDKAAVGGGDVNKAEDSSSQDSKENLLLTDGEGSSSSRKRLKQHGNAYRADYFAQDNSVEGTYPDESDFGIWYSRSFATNKSDTGASSMDTSTSSTALIPITPSSPYAGLVNLGATCYLNSLLQTLFMTPEFRRLMYSWKYDSTVEGTKEDSIPFQLQRLFGIMQLSPQQSLSTRPLTKSFQWDSSEAFQQHDVQELMRVLFDALERSLRASGHPTPNMINDLFQGQLTDYIESLDEEANDITDDSNITPSDNQIVKQHYDYFQDLSLVIKPFGATECISSIEAALEEYIKPELLKKDNAVYFEELDKKLPALKGLRVSKPPYLLTLQLKRFELDYMSPTLRRMKINDRVTFPFLLDLNPFVGDKKRVNTDGVSRYSSLEEQLDIARQHYDRFLNTAYKWLDKRGPHIYELYSVLVHSGSAIGGHYYAFIKNMNTGVWHKFNDSRVTACSVEEVTDTFGNSNSIGSSATAYMLVYRKIVPPGKAALEITGKEEADAESQLLSLSHSDLRRLPTKEEIPQHVCDIVREEEEEQKRKEEAEKREREMKTFFVIREDDKKELKIHQDSTMKDLTAEAWKLFFSEQSQHANWSPSLDCVRLRNWDVHNSVAKEPFDSPETLEAPVWKSHFVNYKTLYLEVRPEDGYFDEYDPSDLLVKVYHCSGGSERIAGPTTIVLPQESSIACLKRRISRNTEIRFPVEQQRIYKILNNYSLDLTVKELVLDFIPVNVASSSPLYPVFYAEDAGENVFYSIHSEIMSTMNGTGNNGDAGGSHEKTESLSPSSGSASSAPPNALADGKASSFRRKDNSSLSRKETGFGPVSSQFTPQEFCDAAKSLPDEGVTLYALGNQLQPLLDFIGNLLERPIPADGARRLENLDNFALPKLYFDQINQITVKYALPDEQFADHFLVADRRSTVGHLREQLSQISGISVDRLSLKKFTRYGSQLNDDKATLADERIFQDTSLYIEQGLRLNPGEYLLRLCVIDASASPPPNWFSLNTDELSTEGICLSEWTPDKSLGGWLPCPRNREYFDADTCLHTANEETDIDLSGDRYPLKSSQVVKNMEIPVTKKSTSDDIRSRVHQTLVEDGVISESLPVGCLRIRKDDRGSPGDVFRSGKTLESNHTFFMTSIEGYCEILGNPEELSYDEVLVNTCWWDKSRGLLTTPREMVLNKNVRMSDLAPALALLSGLNEDQIEYTKPFSDLRDRPERLKLEYWRRLTAPTINSIWIHDGDRIIFADSSIEAPTLKKEEKSGAMSSYSPLWSPTYTPPRRTREKGLRIWLKDEKLQSEKNSSKEDNVDMSSSVSAASAGYGGTVAKKDKQRENETREYLRWQRRYGEFEEDEDIEQNYNAAALFEELSSDD